MKEICLKDLDKLIQLIKAENKHQIEKWGIQNHTIFEWLTFITEELGELANAISEEKFRNGSKEDVVNEAIQTATLSLKIAEMYLQKLKVKNEKIK